MTAGAHIAAALCIALLAACSSDTSPAPPAAATKLIVLGVDGMDPRLVDRFMREGRMPNLAALAERGAYTRLGTSNPPQSPVAWSMFTTGMDSDGHGIYDFVHRDPATLSPYLSTSKAEGGDSVSIGSLAVSTSSARIELLREGDAFWELLGARGVPATVVKVPANFPPADGHGAEVLAGMGTPDLLGTYGTFQIFTDDPAIATDRAPSGGRVHALAHRGTHTYTAALVGPPNPTSADGEDMTLDVDIVPDRKRPVALVRIGDTDALVQPGEWSPWLRIEFDPGLLGGAVPGMVRLFLASTTPHVTLYTSPINVDPSAPAVRLSSPASFAADLARDAGLFYTQGMPEDTKALAAGMLSDEQFLAQAELVFEERLRMLDAALTRHDSGLLFFYFSSIDQVSHVFWRTLEPRDPAAPNPHADVIPALYERIDGVIGDVVRRAPDATILVMSDHGFAPYRRKVHLNAWLASNGYLAVRDDGHVGSGPLGHLDWPKTQAYGLGLNQLFLNVAGRERDGVVPAGERDVLLGRIERDLLAWRDPDTGERVVTAVSRPDPTRYPDRAPDLLVGYNRGYRSADESAMGRVGSVLLEDNLDKWSGDHCMDPRHVPGVLLSSVPLDTTGGATLADLAPTILAHYGLAPLPAMKGRVLWPRSGDVP